ncbi:4-alpha-glucanotransferase, partial [Desulfobulbus sp. F4]|nr:4-alpha-glucanotransferase [Desulfobulbus sp. F4]
MKEQNPRGIGAARASGVLMHISSLPSPFGIGDLGPASHAFVDFLARSGQSCWQVLPLVPVSPA